ncbi:unnamed protein product [Clonostachys byssicola]|uniref:Uncharacterized protein n=1 Tax=Clonostachys byssicola TaxID=160290 RepID=A0A9N9UAG3_9HYPO|nr:unnamed protein product [Clonostachys byssicola]
MFEPMFGPILEPDLDPPNECRSTHSQVPTIHLPFDHRCGACGRAFQDENSVTAVARLDDTTFTTYRIIGTFTTYDAPKPTVRRYESYYPCEADGCALCDDAPEAIACHNDCLNVVYDKRAPQDCLLKLWTAGTWRNPCYRSPPLLLSPSDNPTSRMEAAVHVFPSLARLPHNVQHMILKDCDDAFLWRYATVYELARRMNWDHFYAGTLSIDRIHSWSRPQELPSEANTIIEDLPVEGANNEGYILLIIDSQGLRDILRLPELWDRPDYCSEGLRFISGPAESFSGFSVDFKYGLARLIVPPGRKVQFWRSHSPPNNQMIIDSEGPSPDFPLYTGLFSASHFVSIDLNKCYGLTVFSSPRGVVGMHAHTPESPLAMEAFERLRPRQLKQSVIWFYVPLGPHEKVLSLGLRFQYTQGRRMLPSLIIRLQSGRYTIGPWYNAQNGPAGDLTFQVRGRPTLLYEVPPRYSLSTLTVLPQTEVSKELQTLKARVPQLWTPHPHFSSARLENIDKVLVFSDLAPGFCRGMLITYKDSKKKFVGECRWGHQSLRVYQSPLRLFYYQGAFRAQNAPRSAPLVEVSDVVFDSRYFVTPASCHREGWRSCELKGELHFWFNACESHVSVHQE